MEGRGDRLGEEREGREYWEEGEEKRMGRREEEDGNRTEDRWERKGRGRGEEYSIRYNNNKNSIIYIIYNI